MPRLNRGDAADADANDKDWGEEWWEGGEEEAPENFSPDHCVEPTPEPVGEPEPAALPSADMECVGALHLSAFVDCFYIVSASRNCAWTHAPCEQFVDPCFIAARSIDNCALRIMGAGRCAIPLRIRGIAPTTVITCYYQERGNKTLGVNGCRDAVG